MIHQRQQVRIQKQSNRNKISGYVILIAAIFIVYLIYCIHRHAVEESQRLNPGGGRNAAGVNSIDNDFRKIPQVADIYKSGHVFDRINDNLCPDAGKNIDVLIVISTAIDNFNKRLVLRNTWANHTNLLQYRFSYVFLVGERSHVLSIEDQQRHDHHKYYFPKGRNQIDSIVLENYIFSDVVTGNFIDSYENLTLKTISSLEWSMNNCPLAKFMLKCDDDIFLNVENLSKFIKDKTSTTASTLLQNTIIGHSTGNMIMKPHRNYDSKYFITLNEYAPDIFPKFIFGPSYMLSNDAVSAIYYEAQKHRYLKLEDVFITGIVARKLNITIIDSNKFSMIMREDKYAMHKMVITVHTKNNFELYDLWNKNI